VPTKPANVSLRHFEDDARVEVRTADNPGGPWTVTTVWYEEGNPSAVKVALPDGIRPSALQRFAWAQHLAMADAYWRMHQSAPRSSERRIARAALRASVEKTMAIPPLVAKRPGRAGHPDAFYREIASRYQALRGAGITNPTKTIADERGNTRSTVAGWVRRARDLKYLPPARPGRAG